MDLKIWSPLLDLDREWRFDFPRFVREMPDFHPSIDLTKDDGHLVMTAELPGIDPEDVEVTLDRGILTVKGEKTEEKDISEEDRYVHERTFGAFQRRLSVPDNVKAENISAKFANGVLTVRVTLPEEKTVEPKKIPVASASKS